VLIKCSVHDVTVTLILVLIKCSVHAVNNFNIRLCYSPHKLPVRLVKL
jgi:hypothetical protein